MKIKNCIDKVRLIVSKNFFDFNLDRVCEFNFYNINSIVIWKPDGKLGDSQILSSFIKEVRFAFPATSISIICNSSISNLYKEIFNVSTYVVEKRPSFFSLWKISKKIKQEQGCDLLLSLEATLRPRDIFIAYLLKPKFYTAMCSDAKCINIDLYKLFGAVHISEYFENLFRLGHHNVSNLTYIPFAPKDNDFAKKYITNKAVVGIAPWGASKIKHLSNDVIFQIAKKIQEKTDFFIVLLVTQDVDLLNKELVSKGIIKDRLILLPEKISIIELAEIISNLRGLITVDTANLHIANSFNIPLIGIYNGQDEVLLKQWAPNPHNKECSVFYKKDMFINELSFDEMQESIEKFLNLIK